MEWWFQICVESSSYQVLTIRLRRAAKTLLLPYTQYFDECLQMLQVWLKTLTLVWQHFKADLRSSIDVITWMLNFNFENGGTCFCPLLPMVIMNSVLIAGSYVTFLSFNLFRWKLIQGKLLMAANVRAWIAAGGSGSSVWMSGLDPTSLTFMTWPQYLRDNVFSCTEVH